MSTRRAPLLTTLLCSSLLAACAQTARLPDRKVVAIGRNTQGEACVANRVDTDTAAPDQFDQSLFITCRSASASRPLGAVRLVADTPERMKPLEAALDCGADAPATIAGVAGRARRCWDASLGIEVVRFDASFGPTRLVADAAPALLGPMEETVAIVARRRPAGGNAAKVLEATLDPTTLPAAPARADAAARSAFVDPQGALAQGIGYSRRGLQVDASRVLNDALSRLDPETPQQMRAELQLEAALADSNISFESSAAEHFALADQILKTLPPGQATLLRRKREAYRALDLLNQRRFRAALGSLDALVSDTVTPGQPLLDLVTLRALNQSAKVGATASVVSVPDTTELSQVVLDAQANWARSVALFAIDDVSGAIAAIERARRSFASLQAEKIEQPPLLWLAARIERQSGRLAAQRQDWSAALAAFDRALDYLRRGALAAAGTGTEPAIAETQLERASMFARSGAPIAAVRDEYAAAVEALITANVSGVAAPNGLGGYLDLLAEEAKASPTPDTFERYFRAVQATGEPAVARQFSQIRGVVGNDPAIAAKLRERTDLQREITRLRYAIAAAPQTPGSDVAALEAERSADESRLLAIDADLGRNSRYKSIDDTPATIAELRATLQPGEAFFKLSEVNRRTYGMLLTGEQAFVYRVTTGPAETAALATLGERVRDSIDGRQATEGKLVPYRADEAFALFRILAGPAAEAMLASKALIVDPAGPLATLPIGVLVTEKRAKAADPFDFSQTAFLAARLPISTALSPRSFLVARAAGQSAAGKAFLGLGEHSPPASSADTNRPVSVGFGCQVPFAQLAAESRNFAPIDRRELVIAADALGDPGAPMMTDAAFSDTAIEARTDLGDYQVLHFATHGLTEGQWGCPKSPPALVTSFGGEQSDGLLSFSEIAQLTLDANLVVLSACDTASGVRDEALARSAGQEEAGATLEGLVRAFLAAQARAVLATYWQASAEEDAQQFIRTFYSTARQGTIGGALQAGQRALMTQPRYSHPFFWAPYFIVGDTTKPLLSGPVRVAAR
jgi:CHAT domain-containing protein